MLISGYGTECEILCLVLYIKSGIQQVAVIATFIIVSRFGYISGFFIVESIRVTALVTIFITYIKVELPIVAGQVDGADTSTGRLPFIYLFIVERCIAEETAFVFIKSSSRECKALIHPVIVSDGSIVLIVCTCPYPEVSTLIRERRFGMYFNKSTHRISSVQCTLRTAQHINTLDVGIIEIECRFIYIRYIVNIEAYGGSIDARTDTTNVDGRCQSRTVIRNKYIRDQCCQVLYGVHLCSLHVLLRK